MTPGKLGIRFTGSDKSKISVYEGTPTHVYGALKRNIIIDGNTSVEFADIDINPGNAGEYRYRISLEDGEEPVAWAKPAVFITGSNGYKYASLGHYGDSPGSRLKVEVFYLLTHGVEKTDILDVEWRQIYIPLFTGLIEFNSKQPHVPGYDLTSVALDAIKQTSVNSSKTSGWKSYRFELSLNNFIETTVAGDIKFRLGDSLQNISFHSVTGSSMYFYNVSIKRRIEGRTDSINLGETNTDFNIYKETWGRPGKYTVYFTPKVTRIGGGIQLFPKSAYRITFTVLPALAIYQKTVSLKQLYLIITIIVTTGGYCFVVYRDQQKRKLSREAQKKQIAVLQLQSVRSQLNPHFIFNALAGIQNLMNKNEIGNANKYLVRFARLTRNVLDDGQRELTSIEQEISLLTDYLQMEQLRFGFNYSINIDNHDIDQQVEIPAMLLQPFVENAVKHGVSSLKEKGSVVISIVRKDHDLILSVQDNGKGFTGTQAAGKGIKLCEERTSLLNSIYKNTAILLRKTSDQNGALIIVELKNWV